MGEQRPGARLRVVYLDHCARMSGAELALLRLLPALVNNVEAHVILGEDGPLVARLEAVGVTTEVLPMVEAARGLARNRVHLARFPPATIFHTARYITEVARRLCQLRPDLVHTNSLKAGLYGSVAGRLAGVPVVWHLREPLTADHLPVAAVRLMRASVRRLPTALIANSRCTLGHVSDPRPNSAVINSPVEIRPGKAPRPQGAPLRVGTLGRIAPIKGQHVFLEAFARAFPPPDATRAVIVGAALFGETDYEEQLRRQVVELGLEGRVEMRGFREDVGEELSRLDVLVQASVVTEGFGQVVVEGMAAGLPVIAPCVGGPAEIVTDGHDGVLYPPGDVPALAAVLRRLAADEVLRRRLGDAARVRALDFTPSAIAPQVLALYRTVLGDEGAFSGGCMLARRRRRYGVPMSGQPSAAMMATVQGLVVDQAAGQAIDALRHHGVRAILLKGASFARWLYDDGGARPYNDVDLLVAPDQLAAAGEVLAGLGYVLRCAGAAPGEQADHATNWDRPRSPTIDLHKTMSARVGVSPERCWEVASSQARPEVVGGSPAEVLAPAALALHVVLHAEVGKQKTIDDLVRALSRLDRSDWEAAFALAATLEALPAFGFGLRLLPEGEALADQLGVPTDSSVELVLLASSTSTLARPFDQVARARGIWAKASLVGRELVPTPSFVRLWFPPARRSLFGLVAGYLYRLVWVPWHAPKGLRSWCRARQIAAVGTKDRAGSP